MGWQSGLLGGNVVSSYLHIDNLRNDLTAGKFWDLGGSKYARVMHDGTDGALSTSAGCARVKAASGGLVVHEDAGGVKYVSVRHTSSSAYVTVSSGALYLQAAYTSVLDSTGSYALQLTAYSNRGVVYSVNKIQLASGAFRVEIGDDVNCSYIRMRDHSTGQMVKAAIVGGAWAITAD